LVSAPAPDFPGAGAFSACIPPPALILRKPEKPRAHVLLHDIPKGAFAGMLFRLDADGMAELFEAKVALRLRQDRYIH